MCVDASLNTTYSWHPIADKSYQICEKAFADAIYYEYDIESTPPHMLNKPIAIYYQERPRFQAFDT